jgi:hypothetical protein
MNEEHPKGLLHLRSGPQTCPPCVGRAKYSLSLPAVFVAGLPTVFVAGLPAICRAGEALFKRSAPQVSTPSVWRVKRSFNSYVARTSKASGWLSPIFWSLALALASLLMLCNCATEQTLYYKPDGDQVTFDLESRECMEQAKMTARSDLVDPDAEPDSSLVQEHYERCLYAQGWSRIPPDKTNRALWTWEKNTLSFGNFTMELPSGFSLRTESKWVIGPTWSHQLQAAGPEKKTYLVLQAQESIADPIQVIWFPKPEGYVLYTSGQLDRFDMRWSIFTGHHRQSLVGILGAYIYLEDTRRISVVFSRTLSASDPPVQGYALSLSQKRELDELYLAWVSWIKAQTGAEDKEEAPGLGRYFDFVWEFE